LVAFRFINVATRLAYVSNIDEYKDKLEPLMDKLEQQGKWKKVERRIFKRFFLDKEGILWKYRVCWNVSVCGNFVCKPVYVHQVECCNRAKKYMLC